MDLIDRETMRYQLSHSDSISDAMSELENMRRVDAVRVVHAHWIEYEPERSADSLEYVNEYGQSIFYMCSNCHTVSFRNFIAGWRYCPYCGAIMDDKR